MYRRFRFEGAIHDSLECVPLAVRRKLDLAGLKISLVGWQTLPYTERLALCHLGVDSDGELGVYREILRGFASGAAVPLSQLPPEATDPGPWRAQRVPQTVHERLFAAAIAVSDARWMTLDEEERYALVKLAEPKRTPEKFRELLAELGLAPPAGESPSRERTVCLPPVAGTPGA